MTVTELTDETFKDFITENDIAVIDLWAPWCGPCKMLAPVIEELANEYQGKAAFAKLNIDDNKKTPAELSVMSIPTLLYYKKGKPADKTVGSLPKQKIQEKIEALL